MMELDPENIIKVYARSDFSNQQAGDGIGLTIVCGHSFSENRHNTLSARPTIFLPFAQLFAQYFRKRCVEETLQWRNSLRILF